MTDRPPRPRAAVVRVALALAACGAAAPAAAQTCTPHPPAGAHAHGHMHGGVIEPPPGDTARWTAADVRFMTRMIGHHAQALEMARLAPERASTSSLRVLAARIENAQTDEIATMETWLRDRRQPVPPRMTTAQMAEAGHALMPGMVTAAQLEALEIARGPEFDRLFLTYMIEHHRGAVCMVSELFSSYGAGQDEAVFKFASDVNVDQSTEIARMQRMLAALLFESPQP